MTYTYFRTAPAGTVMPIKPNEAVLAGMLGGNIPEEPRGGGPHFGDPPRADSKTMRDAVKDGSVTEATIKAAHHVLHEIDRFGYLDGKQKHTVTAQDVEANAAIIEETAEDAAVLLKNERNAVPLKSADLEQMVLIGPSIGE